MNYQKRCYERYQSTQWNAIHRSSADEYRILAASLRRRFKKHLPTDKGARILDLACGSGHYLYFLQMEGYSNAQGIDLNREQIETALRNGVRNVEEGDMFEFLRNQKCAFDCIFANDIIEHLGKNEILLMLDLIHGALKMDGVAIISTLNAQALFGAADYFSDFTHQTGFTPVSLRQILSVCYFDEILVMGETPAAHDLRSAVRLAMWKAFSSVLWIIKMIERGTGRGLWKQSCIFEHRIIGIAKKRNESIS